MAGRTWSVSPFSIDNDVVAGISPQIELTRIAPNPSRGPIDVSFRLAFPGPVRLSVVDIAGRQVATLVDGPRRAGAGTARWDLAGPAGARVPAGIYFLRLEALGQSCARKTIRVE